jgi:HK97 family phage major capsid protein
MNDAAAAIETAAADADMAALEADFDGAVAEAEERKAALARYERVAAARAAAPDLTPQVDARVVSEASVYRPDAQHSFFRDLVYQRNDREAAERMQRHAVEMRAVSGASGGGGDGFIPPQYLGQFAVEVARQGRPFANVLPSAPLPDTGNVITIPKMSTGTTVASQTEGSSVSSTDVTSTQISVNVRTIAGQQDISLQLLERSTPAFDQIIFRDLALAHATELDRQTIRGATGSNEHLGLHNVSGVNTVSYTDASPTAAEAIPSIYNSLQQILSNRYLPADYIVMHPRRAAWFAAGLSSSFPLFQQGGFYRGVGDQDGGVVGTIAGVPVIADANCATNYGSGTNQDEIYVVRTQDMVLMETPLVTRVADQVLSGNLQVRLQVWNYSAFASQRYPSGISIISGTGLVTPTF